MTLPRWATLPACPYDELDPEVVPLVRMLNMLPGVYTAASCGGHEIPVSGASAPADQWWIGFGLDYARRRVTPSKAAWLSLEWLTWAINDDMARSGWNVDLGLYSAPPYLNTPGRMLTFHLAGCRAGDGGKEPAEVADQLEWYQANCV